MVVFPSVVTKTYAKVRRIPNDVVTEYLTVMTGHNVKEDKLSLESIIVYLEENHVPLEVIFDCVAYMTAALLETNYDWGKSLMVVKEIYRRGLLNLWKRKDEEDEITEWITRMNTEISRATKVKRQTKKTAAAAKKYGINDNIVRRYIAQLEHWEFSQAQLGLEEIFIALNKTYEYANGIHLIPYFTWLLIITSDGGKFYPQKAKKILTKWTREEL